MQIRDLRLTPRDCDGIRDKRLDARIESMNGSNLDHKRKVSVSE